MKDIFKKLKRDMRTSDKYIRHQPEGMTLLEYMEMVDKPYLSDHWLNETLKHWEDALVEARNTGDRNREKIAEERIQYYADEKKKRL